MALTRAAGGRLRIPLDRMLRDGIEGYLLGDLDSMAIEIQPKEMGAVGYPMVMAVLSGSELLGALTSTAKEDNRIEAYWRAYMARVEPRYEYLGKIAKQLARNGIAHSYLSHLGVLVQRGGGRHLVLLNGEVIFDCLQLHADFRRSYTEYALPYILDNRDQVQRRLNALFEHDPEKMAPIAKLPPELFPSVEE